MAGMIKTVMGATTALVLGTLTAQAGGIDRSRLPYSALFEAGRYVELGFSHVSPDVTGTFTGATAALGTQTGNMAGSYTTFSFAYKADLNENLSYALFVNTPYGANASYSLGAYAGLQAEWTSEQAALILKYKASENISIYGGLRYVESSARIALPARLFGASAAAVGNYTATGQTDGQVGYVLGAAYEIPDIALRVGLTYESEIDHGFATTETFSGLVAARGGQAVTNITLPQSLTLDFQTGIAEDTLLFGMIKWSEWSKWQVSPPRYAGVVAAAPVITGFDNDVITYQLGVGRRLNENLSVFARATYEKANGGIASRLSPTDGSTAIGIGATWRQDGIKITGGLEYAEVGDAVDGSGTRFQGNSAVGFGLTVGYNF